MVTGFNLIEGAHMRTANVEQRVNGVNEALAGVEASFSFMREALAQLIVVDPELGAQVAEAIRGKLSVLEKDVTPQGHEETQELSAADRYLENGP